jgi:DNA processing protein
MIIAAQRSGGRWPSFSAAKTVSRDVGSHPSATTGHKIERMFGVMSRMELTNERLDLLAACRIRGISWELVAREAQRVGRVGPLLDGDIGEKGQAATEARELLAVAPPLEERREEVLREHEAATAAGARLITVLDEDYPENLRVIFNLPPFIYVLGKLQPEDARSVAVVGTRQASPEGISRARRMAQLLAERGVTVVSGLASGIDTAAHESVLTVSGARTVAVMGTGILGRYPKENAQLADRIATSGALVAQFWPTSPPQRYNFPRRNVVTSGISQGTVVIEASATSGAKMQARLAIEHGKTVFLVESLVMQQKWARDYVARHGRRVAVVKTVDDVMTHLRSVEQVEHLTSQRRQLAFDLA